MTEDGSTSRPAASAAPAGPDDVALASTASGSESTVPGSESTVAGSEPQAGAAARSGVRPGSRRATSNRRKAGGKDGNKGNKDGGGKDGGKGRKKDKPKRSFLRELPGIIVTALVISVLIKTFLVQAFYIPSGSMENTLLVNDRVLVNKLADKPDEIHRGDVVVFRDPGGWLSAPGEQPPAEGGVRGALRRALVFVGLAPASGEEDLIKRVIGVGGDHVVGRNGRVFVNGVRLNEPYVYPGDKATTEPFDVRVPEDTVWVMGDHRSVSEDSRAHQSQPGRGFVPVEDVIGRAFTIVWPLNRASTLQPSGTIADEDLSGTGGSGS